jgi:hypothetical protein
VPNDDDDDDDGMQKIEQWAKKCIELLGEYVE